MTAATPHIVFSVSKSICGTLGGILADGCAAGDFRSDLDTDQAAIQVLALLDGVGVPVVLEHPGITSTRAATS